jgi:hypothetical protein
MDAHTLRAGGLRSNARRAGLLVVVVGIASPPLAAATHETANFRVEAPSAKAAKAVAERAEVCRELIAKAWLGRTLPNWTQKCPVKVSLTGGEAGGLTTFDFDKRGVARQIIKVEGRLDRILASALPHEVTHTIFAAFFGGPMPRWADEGASLLSEDAREIERHEKFVWDLLKRRGAFPLGRLFSLEEYPNDLMGFYGQGYSVARFLVEIGGRPRFLQFVKEGMHGGWDAAARAHYGLADCRELDRAWRSWYKVVVVERTRGRTGDDLVMRAQSDD